MSLKVFFFAILLVFCISSINAFIGQGLQAGLPAQKSLVKSHARRGVSVKMMARDEEEELKKLMRSARKAGANDRVVEIRKPLGLVLEEDERGNVYVASVNPGGNADKTRKVEVGDKIVMISATFGEELWSTRGVGLASIMKAVQVRAAPSCKVVFESSDETSQKSSRASKMAAEKKAREESEQQKRDRLLAEFEATEKKIASKKKFFGLF